MIVSVNGEPRTVPDGTNITGLVTALGLSTQRVAVELNGDIVARDRYSEQVLAAGDVLEIVQFVGGG